MIRQFHHIFTRMSSSTAKHPKPPMLIDIGINLTHRQFQRDHEEVIQRASDAGIGCLILTGTSVQDSIKAHQLCETFSSSSSTSSQSKMYLFSKAGVHPHVTKYCNETTIHQLQQLAQNSSHVVAIGECGLDYDRNLSPPNIQRIWFTKILDLAIEMKLPVFLHERAAHKDFFNILSSRIHQLPAAVVHCFTGNQEQLENYLSLPNCYIGITGWICDERRGQNLRDIVSIIPDNRLMIETDGPFLFPRDLPKDRYVSNPKKKGRRNEPAYLDHICTSIAQCRDQTPEHVAEITTANAIRFFQLQPLMENGKSS